MKTNTKLFWILFIATMISIVLIIPYIYSAQREILEQAGITPPMLLLVSVIQGGIVFGLAIFFGLILAEKTGFKLPLLTSWIEKRKIKYSRTFWISVLLGISVGLAIFLIDKFIFNQAIILKTTWWQGLLASFYGGIAEEILMRLFLVSLLVFIMMKLTKRKQKSSTIVWIAIILVSVIFGIGHLPITAAVSPLTTWIVFRAILLNGIGGVVFGFLYWKKGLESAIIAHFTADIFLHVFAWGLLRG
jgi:membrane protease YdiL (CAAX protease family)